MTRGVGTQTLSDAKGEETAEVLRDAMSSGERIARIVREARRATQRIICRRHIFARSSRRATLGDAIFASRAISYSEESAPRSRPRTVTAGAPAAINSRCVCEAVHRPFTALG
jgi:hypothetical protein